VTNDERRAAAVSSSGVPTAVPCQFGEVAAGVLHAGVQPARPLRPHQEGGAAMTTTLTNHLSFETLRAANVLRCETAFHQVSEWRPSQWSNAMAGECGEACNLTKKMDRMWPAGEFIKNWNKPEDQRMADLEERLADEIADVVIYADLLAARIGRSLGECVRRKFNAKSDEIGSDVKLS
jgi:NTP pyrophosphatase (non-canonical NTP hydrolase)